MSVLKPIKDSDTVQINVKIPVELRDRMNKVKDKLKDKGYTIDIGDAAVAGINRLVKSAEKELQQLEAAANPAPAKSPAKPATKPATKSTTSTAAARA